MWTRLSLARFLCCLLLATIIETAIAYAEPEPMARPTRPKVFTSREELERYADLVRDYYLSVAKARYGKRGDALPMTELNSTWEALKMIQDAQRENEERRRERIRQNKEQALLRNFQNLNADKHTSRLDARPGYLRDIIGKYYDDVQ